MLLIVLMPVVSRSMPMTGAMTGMAADCAMHAEHAGHQQPGHPEDPTARCGYCVLFMHTPAIGFMAPPTLPPADLVSFTPTAKPSPGTLPAPLLSAHPRGPPRAYC
ncbi:hypothetical protein GCM10027066_18970 [Dyella jejuensis]